MKNQESVKKVVSWLCPCTSSRSRASASYMRTLAVGKGRVSGWGKGASLHAPLHAPPPYGCATTCRVRVRVNGCASTYRVRRHCTVHGVTEHLHSGSGGLGLG